MTYQQKTKISLGLKILVGSFILMGLWATLGHYIGPRPPAEAFVNQLIPPGPEWFLQQLPRYDDLPITTFLHIVPAFLFFILLGIQLIPSLRLIRPRLHRTTGRILILLAITYGIAGLILGLLIPFGGELEIFTTIVVAIAFFFCLYRGLQFARRRQFAPHRQWMLRMVALSFAPLTMRLIMMPLGFIEFIDIQAVFGPLMIISSVINLMVLEMWILRDGKFLSRSTLTSTKSGIGVR